MFFIFGIIAMFMGAWDWACLWFILHAILD